MTQINLNYYQRQLGLVDSRVLTMPITIIGAGGIGSWTTLALAKMGCQALTVYDGDTIEEANIGSQLYTSVEIGFPKADALQNHLLTLVDVMVTTHAKHWEESTVFEKGILIAAVDSMAVRRKLFETHRGKQMLFIDGRMAGNEIHIFTVYLADEAQCAEYEMTLFTDEEADPIPCSERAVMYNTFVCGGLIASTVARLANGEPVKFEVIVDLMNFYME